MGGSEEVRGAFGVRLAARRFEIERAIAGRIVGMPGLAERSERPSGLEAAVSAGVEYGLAGVRCGMEAAGPIPAALLAQLERSARSGDLDAALRDCFAAYVVFCSFVLEEAEGRPTRAVADLRVVLPAVAALFERVLAAVAGAFSRERRARPRLPGARQLACVKGLLAGDRVDPACLAYEIDHWHLGAVVLGRSGPAHSRELARAAECRLLLVRPETDVAWVWFGGRRRVQLDGLLTGAASDSQGMLILAGEPARGLEGWRLSHQQAQAVLRATPPDAEGLVRYAEVGLLASISQDRVLTRSLHQMYLAPLADANDGGSGLRATLRAYFAAGRNVSSAASALGVSRQTVGSRLRVVEERLGRPLAQCAPELEMALQLDSRTNHLIGGGLSIR